MWCCLLWLVVNVSVWLPCIVVCCLFLVIVVACCCCGLLLVLDLGACCGYVLFVAGYMYVLIVCCSFGVRRC